MHVTTVSRSILCGRMNVKLTVVYCVMRLITIWLIVYPKHQGLIDHHQYILLYHQYQINFYPSFSRPNFLFLGSKLLSFPELKESSSRLVFLIGVLVCESKLLIHFPKYLLWLTIDQLFMITRSRMISFQNCTIYKTK